MTYIWKSGELFSCRHFESEALSRSPRQLSMENRIWCLEKFKLVSNGNITKNIPFLDVYGDINLVSHVIKCLKARKALWKIWSCDNLIYISIHIQKWYLICYISIWDQFKLFKTSNTAFHTRLSWWPRLRFTFKWRYDF